MIITDKFVYVHQPKTGGTFVIRSLAQLFKLNTERSLERDYKIPQDFSNSEGTFIVLGKKHGICAEIDPCYLESRAILSNIRNPFDLYVSEYEFEWWKREERFIDYEVISDFRKKYPDFPNLSFREYMNLQYDAYVRSAFNVEFEDLNMPGLSTFRFLRYYAIDYSKTLRKLVSGKGDEVNCSQELFKCSYLRTNNLNKDLYSYLLKNGYDNNKIEFILKKGKVFPLGKGRTSDQGWRKYYDDNLLNTILRKDAFLFNLFPEFLEDL